VLSLFLNYRFDSSLNLQFKFEPTQETPNKIQIKIQLVTLANYKPKIIHGAKLNLGIPGEKQEGILMCCMSTQIQIKFLEIPHFDIKQILRMLQPMTPLSIQDQIQKFRSIDKSRQKQKLHRYMKMSEEGNEELQRIVTPP
jgi:hypothetical protein